MKLRRLYWKLVEVFTENCIVFFKNGLCAKSGSFFCYDTKLFLWSGTLFLIPVVFWECLPQVSNWGKLFIHLLMTQNNVRSWPTSPPRNVRKTKAFFWTINPTYRIFPSVKPLVTVASRRRLFYFQFNMIQHFSHNFELNRFQFSNRLNVPSFFLPPSYCSQDITHNFEQNQFQFSR